MRLPTLAMLSVLAGISASCGDSKPAPAPAPPSPSASAPAELPDVQLPSEDELREQSEVAPEEADALFEALKRDIETDQGPGGS